MAEQSLQDVMSEAMRLSHRLESVTDETYRVANRLAKATHTFEQAYAVAWARVRAELGPRDGDGEKRLVKDYEAEVTIRTAAESEAVEDLKSQDRALDVAGRNLRQQLSATQSTASALREEMRLAGGPA